MEMIWDWGIDITLALQRNNSFVLPMQIITFTGSNEFFLLILPALYWLVDRWLGIRMATLLLLTILLGVILKLLGHGPRPYWFDPQVQLLAGPEATFGLPSIHTMNAVVMWSLLAHYINHLWAWLVAGLLIIFAGIARVYLGVHFPSDVIAGLVVGIMLLWLWWRWSTPVGDWFAKFTPFPQFLLGAILSLIFILLGVAARELTLTIWEPTTDWPAQVTGGIDRLLAAFSLADIMTATGMLVGTVGGILFCNHRGAFAVSGTFLQYVGRYLLGVIGVLIIWQGLDVAFALLAVEESSLGYALRYLRYAAIGFWIFGLAPQLFIGLRLVHSAENE